MKADNTSVSVGKGDSLLIQLEETLTAGFEWAVESIPGFCQVLSSEYIVPASDAAGASGTRVFTIGITGRGDGHLVLKNHQRWSGETDKRFQLHIQAS